MTWVIKNRLCSVSSSSLRRRCDGSFYYSIVTSKNERIEISLEEFVLIKVNSTQEYLDNAGK
jgi:hypothetical protein